MKYLVLDKDNIEEIQKLTGIAKNELEDMLKQCENFGFVQVFWREFNRWFGTRFDGSYVQMYGVPELMREVFRRTGRVATHDDRREGQRGTISASAGCR